MRLDQLLQSSGITVGSVLPQQVVIDGMNLCQLIAGEALRNRFDAFADDGRKHRQVELRADLLCGGQRFERHLVKRAVALLQNGQDTAHRTLASNRSFSTSFAAASFAGPSKICERFVFSGR